MGMKGDEKRVKKKDKSSGKYITNQSKILTTPIDLRRMRSLFTPTMRSQTHMRPQTRMRSQTHMWPQTHLHRSLLVRLVKHVHPTWHTRSLTHRNGRCRRTSTRPRHFLILVTRPQRRILMRTRTVDLCLQMGGRGNSRLGCGRRVWIERVAETTCGHGHGAKAQYRTTRRIRSIATQLQ